MEGKKRSLSQRIGETGESIVRLWASRNNLSASKFEYDYGWDFTMLCFDKDKKIEGLNERNFLVQCKATENINERYVKIDKSDALLYLASTSQFCLLAVDNNNDNIKYRFGDAELVDMLITFVNSGNDSLNLPTATQFFDGNNISNHLKTVTLHSYYNRLKTYIAQKMVCAKIPSIKLATKTDENGTSIAIQSPWVTSVISPEYLFTNGNFGEIFSNPQIIQILKEHYPDYSNIEINGSIGIEADISGGNGKPKTKAIAYPFNGNTHFRTKSGFTFVAGPCEDINGEHIHKCTFSVENSIYPLCNCMDDINAFQGILKTNEFYINGHQFISLTPSDPMRYMISFFETCCDVVKLNSLGISEYGEIQAANLNDYNTFLTATIVSALSDKSNVIRDFVMSNDDDFSRKSVDGLVPIVFQIQNQKYIAKVEASFEIFTKNKMLLGIGSFNPISVNFEKFNWNRRNIIIPELWVNSNFPIIPLGPTDEMTIRSICEEIPFGIE